MASIIGIPGSWRQGSYNKALLRAAIEVAPSGLQVHEASIEDIPLYDGDVEREQGVPSAVESLKERIASSDGLLLVSPEYNNSIPGTLKNAIDWLTRPAKDIGRVFGNRPVALTGATPGRGGTRLAQLAWLPVFRTLGMRPYFGSQLYVAGASKVFDDQGNLVDDTIRELLTKFMGGFADFVDAQGS